MKTPLKELQSLAHNNIGPLRPMMKVNDEELEAFFGEDFAKATTTKSFCVEPNKFSERHDAVSVELQEWNAFASFDPINDTSMSSITPLLLRKRVQFAADENGKILCSEYACVKIPEDIRETWYSTSDFRQFRAWCQETAASAILDMDYCNYFHMVYAVCSSDRPGNRLPVVDVECAVEFAKYRGLERVIFRKELQTDKLASIQGVVWTQNDAMIVSEEGLADTSRKLTSSARKMAQYLAASDSAVAQQSPTDSVRRFIEI
jgi:hypothetical protein